METLSIETGLRRTIEIGRHGPTAWISGHQPGIWPSSVVRKFFKPAGVIICCRQRARPRLRQAGAECTETKDQIIAAHQRDRNFMRRKHALGREDFLAVQEDMAECRQSFETQDRVAGLGIEKPAEIPGIPRVQRLGIFPVEEPGFFERGGDCAGNRCRSELCRERDVVRHGAGARLRQDQVPAFGK